jgi:hypothetical protein
VEQCIQLYVAFTRSLTPDDHFGVEL